MKTLRLGILGVLSAAAPVFAQFGAQPDSITDVDNPARQPITFQVKIPVDAGSQTGFATGPFVPFGKRLVIETISFQTLVPKGQGAYLQIYPSASGQESHVMPAAKMITPADGIGDIIGAIGAYRMYVNPKDRLGASVWFSFYLSGRGTFPVAVTFTGYFVNLPSDLP